MELLRLGIEPAFDLLEKLRLDVDKRIMIASDTTIFRDERGELRLQLSDRTSFSDSRVTIDVSSRSGSAHFDGGILTWSVAVANQRRDRSSNAGYELFDANESGPAMILRNWQRGDRFQ